MLLNFDFFDRPKRQVSALLCTSLDLEIQIWHSDRTQEYYLKNHQGKTHRTTEAGVSLGRCGFPLTQVSSPRSKHVTSRTRNQQAALQRQVSLLLNPSSQLHGQTVSWCSGRLLWNLTTARNDHPTFPTCPFKIPKWLWGIFKVKAAPWVITFKGRRKPGGSH